MKKVFAILLGLVMLFSVHAFCESTVELFDGIYFEEKDIQAGLYSFSCGSATEGYCIVATFADETHYTRFLENQSVLDGLKENTLHYEIIQQGDECTVKIDKNNVLLVKNGSGQLSLKQAASKKDDAGSDTDAAKHSYEALLATLKSTDLTSGQKLMARIRFWAENQYGGSMKAATRLYESSMTARGFSSVSAKEIFIKAQAGEEIHCFHRVEYEAYNMPAEKNGLENDTIFVLGTIRKYISDGGKKNCIYGLIVEQKDGNKWLVYCAEKNNGELIGKQQGAKSDQHVFEGYKDQAVTVYGKYLGYSEKYKLPVIDIVTYGGMVLQDENMLIATNTADTNMRIRGGMSDFQFLIGAESKINSIERYTGR